MKNCNKRLLAAALALCITAGFVPAQAVKDESAPVLSASVVPARLPTEETAEFSSPQNAATEEEFTLDAALYSAAPASDAPLSGYCGAVGNEENVSWQLDPENRVLTISGTGAMMEYEPGTSPWYDWCYQNAWYAPQEYLSVVIGEGITEIYSLHYIRLASLQLPSTLKKIGNCFSDVSNGRYGFITTFELTLPAGLESVAPRAFYGVDNISKLTILCPDSAFETAGEYEYAETFSQCDHLQEVIFPEGWTTIPASIVSRCENLQSVSIPSTVTSIGAEAFRNAYRLTAVDLPDGLTSIGDSAFYHCSALTDVNLPDGLTTIGSGAFGYCKLLSLDTFPDTLKYIHYGAFSSSPKVTASPWTTAMLDGGFIGGYAFSGTASITGHLTIPDTITYEAYSFADCDGITSVTLPPISDFKTMEGLFSECDGLTEITIPEGWKDIPPLIFSKCSNLTDVHFPSGSFRIMYGAFSGSGLTEITIPARAVLENDVFWQCKNLKSVTIESMSSTPNSLFGGCSSLTTVNLPQNLVEIGPYTFEDCTRLTSINLPDSLKKIDQQAFRGCSALTEITIPEGVTKLEIYTFSGCTSLAKVNLPETMTHIGCHAFGFCSSLSYIVIPDSVYKISYEAFAHSGLKQVRFMGNSPKFTSEDAGWVSPGPAFPSGTTLFYTAGNYGWTTPTWNGYATYPILGSGNFHDSSADYYSSIGLYHFTFETDAGPLDGVSISYQDGTLTCKTGEYEVSVGMVVTPGEYVTFTRQGYHDVSLPVEVLNNFNTVEFTAVSETTPFIQAVYARHDNTGTYTDLIHDNFAFEGGSMTETTQFYLDINWNGYTPGEIFISRSLLAQDGWKLNGNFYNAGYLSSKLSVGDDLYLLISNAETPYQAVNLNTIITPATYEQDLSICADDGVDIAVSSGGSNDITQLLSEFEFGYDLFENLPAKINVSADGTVKMLLGITAEDTLLKEDFDTYYGTLKDKLLYEQDDLNSFESLRSLLSNRGKGLAVGKAKVGIDGEFQVFGYAEGKFFFDPMTGKPGCTFHEAAIGFSVEGSVSESCQAYISGYPIYFSASLSDKFTTTIPLVMNPDVPETLIPPYHVAKLKNDLTARLGAGLGWDEILSAGVYGQGSGILEGYLPFAFEDSSLVLEFSFGLEADVFSIFTVDVPIFSGSHTVWPKEDTAAVFAARRLSQMNWQQASRDYLDAEPDTVQTFALDDRNTTLTKSMIDQSIYPGADVQFLANDDYSYAVWTEDPGKYTRPEPNNRTKLYYSYRYGANGRWSSPSALVYSDDNTADFNPVLKEIGDSVYVLWQNANRALTADDTIETLPGTIDISCAKIRGSVIGTVGTEYYDTAADITLIGDTPYIVWASNSDNSPFSGNGTYSIHRQALITDVETEMETLITGLNCVDGLTADGDRIWYSTDTNFETDSFSDYAVFCYENGTVSQVSESGATKPTVVNGILTWYENGSVRVGNELIPLAADTDRYQYLTSPNGFRALVYTVDDDMRHTTVYASFNDGTGWGNPIAMTGISGNVRSFSAGFDSSGALCVLACDRGLDPDSSNYLSGTAGLGIYCVTPYSDLAITNATYLSHSLVKGGHLDLVIDVVNNGMASPTILQTNAYNGNTLLASSAAEAPLPSGHSGQVYVSIPLNDPTSLTDLRVEITAGGYTDKTPEDNTASVSLRLSDVSLEGGQLVETPNGITLHTMVVNRGQTDLSDLTATLYGEDGQTVLDTCSISALDCGDGEVISFPITQSDESQLLTVQVCSAGLDVMDENIVGNNKISVLVDGIKTVNTTAVFDASVKQNSDGSVDVAAITSNQEIQYLYIAGYDTHGRMVDVVTSDHTFLGGTLSGSDIIKVKVFGLNAALIPITDHLEYDI